MVKVLRERKELTVKTVEDLLLGKILIIPKLHQMKVKQF